MEIVKILGGGGFYTHTHTHTHTHTDNAYFISLVYLRKSRKRTKERAYWLPCCINLHYIRLTNCSLLFARELYVNEKLKMHETRMFVGNVDRRPWCQGAETTQGGRRWMNTSCKFSTDSGNGGTVFMDSTLYRKFRPGRRNDLIQVRSIWASGSGLCARVVLLLNCREGSLLAIQKRVLYVLYGLLFKCLGSFTGVNLFWYLCETKISFRSHI